MPRPRALSKIALGGAGLHAHGNMPMIEKIGADGGDHHGGDDRFVALSGLGAWAKAAAPRAAVARMEPT
jgi:hypothetical protein